MKVKITIIDDDGEEHSGEIMLKNKQNTKKEIKLQSIPYRPGSTAEKIVLLISEGFFNKNRTISDIVEELKSHDFHYKSTDLTWPLRNLVRKNIFVKTKKLENGIISKNWTYIKR